jgi:replicative DNA helicase
MMRPPLDKVPPQSLDAEMCTLGSMLIDRVAIDKVAETLNADDFYREIHRHVYDAIVSLHERDEAVDMVTVKEELIRRDLLSTIGGVDYLAQLMESVPSAANAEYYASIVEEKAILRRLQSAAHRIVQMSENEEEDINDILGKAEQCVFDVGQRRMGSYFTPIKPLVSEMIDKLEQLYLAGKPVIGLPSGFEQLDRMTSGLQPSDLIILAARPSMGKTSLCLSMAQHAALREEKTVALFSLEMSKEQLVQRMLSAEANIGGTKLRTGSLKDDDWQRLSAACEKLHKAKIWIDDAADISSLEMRAKCRRLKAEAGLDLIVVDYLQLMRGSRRTENRTQEISEIARSLKALAKELRVPVLALSQLSRAVEHRDNKRPMLSDLRESGSIEAEADIVMFIYREEYYKRRDAGDDDPTPSETPGGIRTEEAEIIISKQRNGPVGTIKLAFQPDYARFRNLASD